LRFATGLALCVQFFPDAQASRSGLLHLEHAGQHIERDRVEWSPLRSAFMRVRATGRDSLPASLQDVRVEVVPAGAPPTLEALRSETKTVDAEHGIYHFELGGAVPVQELEVELPSDNSIISGELWARDKPHGPMRRIAEARFYRIASDGKSLFGPRISTGLEHARYYELHIDRTRPGLGQARPTLVTYHAPERLLFLRHGTGPYTVAYGRYGWQRGSCRTHPRDRSHHDHAQTEGLAAGRAQSSLRARPRGVTQYHSLFIRVTYRLAIAGVPRE
jgi:hypothetical protein